MYDSVLARPLVLVVGEDPRDLVFVGRHLDDHVDCDVCFAATGGEALALLETRMPDLVLLDVRRPDADGFLVCRAMRAVPATRDVPVLFLAAERDLLWVRRAFESGGTDFVTKPFDGRELASRVRAHLQLRRQREELQRQKELLTAALARVWRLEGLIPICMYCHRMGESEAAWQRLEAYIAEHEDARFSHGICPSCFAERFPEAEPLSGRHA